MRRIAIAGLALVSSVIARADLENQVFTSKPDGVQIVVPRGWRATDQPTYPGLLLSMTHDAPEAHVVLTAEPFTRDVYCGWALECRTSHDALPTKLACALGKKLGKDFGMHVGVTQAGPRENEANGIPTVWFEYDDGKHYFRQAVALTEDRVVTLLLSTGSADARTAYVRAFEQALRTLKPLEQAEEPAATPAPVAAPADAGVPADGGLLPDAGTPTATPGTFTPAPAPKINPVGSCAVR